MPSITIKRKTAVGYDELYPTTDWSQINNIPSTFTPTSHTHGNISNVGVVNTNTTPASGQHLLITSSTDVVQQSSITIGTATTTFLRNDGQWATPADSTTLTGLGVTSTAAELNILDGAILSTTELNYVDGVTSSIQTQLNGKAASSHTHATSDITSGTLGVARGGLGSTSFNNGALPYYQSTTGTLVTTNAATQNYILLANQYNGVHYYGAWQSPATVGAVLGPELYTTTTITSLAANTLSSSYTVTGYRFATVQLSQTASNTTTTVWTGRIDLTDTNQRGTTTGNQRYHRMVWNNGTSTFADNLEIYSASSTSIQFRHNAGVTFRYRITWEE